MALVVGVDGSLSCLDAVRVAAIRASRQRGSVRLVHAFAWVPDVVPFGPFLLAAEGQLREQARQMLAEAEAMARQVDPSLPIERRLLTGAPAPVLIGQAATAEMIVLGDRGLGGFTGLLIGSIAVQVATHSPVPVLVVKGNIATEGPVVVGIDGSPGSEHTMLWARREAQARHAPLQVETAQGHNAGRAAELLIRLSETAQLIVVGSRGLGGFAGLLLGSVSQHVLHHSRCPVLIVPHPSRSTNVT